LRGLRVADAADLAHPTAAKPSQRMKIPHNSWVFRPSSLPFSGPGLSHVGNCKKITQG
jgi:hypothetical protein